MGEGNLITSSGEFSHKLFQNFYSQKKVFDLNFDFHLQARGMTKDFKKFLRK